MYIYVDILDNSISAVWKLTGSLPNEHILATSKVAQSLLDERISAPRTAPRTSILNNSTNCMSPGRKWSDGRISATFKLT
jgi:hypothetical protein